MPSLVVTISGFPTCKGLADSFAPLSAYPPVDITLPPFPTFGQESMGSIRSIPNKVVQWIQNLQQSYLLLVVSAIGEVVSSILGGALDSLLPEVPGLGLTFSAFLAVDPAVLFAAVKQAVVDGVTEITSLIPSPIYAGISCLDLELVEIVKSVASSYIKLLTEVLTNLVNDAADILSVAGLPPIPVIPTLASLQGMVADWFTVNTGSLQDAISALFPVLPNPILPDPIIPTFAAPALEYRQAMNMLLQEMTTLPLSMIADFADTVLGVPLPELEITIELPLV